MEFQKLQSLNIPPNNINSFPAEINTPPGCYSAEIDTKLIKLHIQCSTKWKGNIFNLEKKLWEQIRQNIILDIFYGLVDDDRSTKNIDDNYIKQTWENGSDS